MKSVAIIGAGPAGLVAAKSCLEEGLTPVVFEKSGSLGGLWRGGIKDAAWDGMRTNLSRWSCMFSDFPWRDKTDAFPTQKEMLRYLQAYADRFKVTPHIRFNHEITSVERAGARWRIGNQLFDNLIIASGFFSAPKIPVIPGQDNFAGRTFHAAQFNGMEEFSGKIAVIGNSFSGSEIVSRLAAGNHDVTHVLRNPNWILSRYVGNTPNDFVFYSRDPESKPPVSLENSRRITARFLEASFGNPGSMHNDLLLDPEIGQPNFVAIADDYMKRGFDRQFAVARGHIDHLESDRIVLSNGKTVPAQTIIYATGYESRLDYLPQSLRDELQFDSADTFMPLTLHQATWSAVPNLAFVGFYRGPYFGVMELQARNAAAVMAGVIPFPAPEAVENGLQNAFAIKATKPRPQFPYDDYIGLSDELAANLGIKPNPVSGPVIPSHYRLTGRHAKPDVARKIIASIPR